MKKFICLLSLLLSLNALAAGGSNGAGIVFGDPSGLTFQHKMSEEQFVDAYFAYTWDEEWILMGDYKFHLLNVFDHRIPVTPYVGFGAFLKIEDHHHNDDVALGVRIPVGVDWQVPQAPIKVFAELVPALRIVKSTDGDFQAGIGGRFYF